MKKSLETLTPTVVEVVSTSGSSEVTTTSSVNAADMVASTRAVEPIGTTMPPCSWVWKPDRLKVAL